MQVCGGYINERKHAFDSLELPFTFTLLPEPCDPLPGAPGTDAHKPIIIEPRLTYRIDGTVHFLSLNLTPCPRNNNTLSGGALYRGPTLHVAQITYSCLCIFLRSENLKVNKTPRGAENRGGEIRTTGVRYLRGGGGEDVTQGRGGGGLI